MNPDRSSRFPDWLLATGELRCNDPRYLERVARLYREIGAQLRGLMWQDGGPVLGRTGPMVSFISRSSPRSGTGRRRDARATGR